MMGGDGGLTNTLVYLREEVSFDKVQFVSLPFGSGCDTARISNWGRECNDNHLMFLDEICAQIADQTTIDKLNIWEMQIQFKQRNGDVLKVNAQGEDYSIRVKGKNDIIVPMACYFSMGQCARIGYNFERNRTGTKCCNYLVYGLMTLKNICCGCCCYPENENIPLKDLLDYSAVIKEQEKR